MIEAILRTAVMSNAVSEFNASLLPEPQRVESIWREVKYQDESGKPTSCTVTAHRHNELVRDHITGNNAVIQTIVFKSSSDEIFESDNPSATLIPQEIKQSDKKPVRIGIMGGGSADSNSIVRYIVSLSKALYQMDEGKPVFDHPIEIVLLSNTKGSAHEDKIGSLDESARLLKQSLNQAGIGKFDAVIGHSAGSLITHLVEDSKDKKSEILCVEVDPTNIFNNPKLALKFLGIPFAELFNGQFAHKPILERIRATIDSTTSSFLSSDGETDLRDIAWAYSIGFKLAPKHLRELAKRWGLKQPRGINPKAGLLSQRHEVFDKTNANIHLLTMRGSVVVNPIERDPDGKRRSPKDLIVTPRSQLLKELRNRTSELFPGKNVTNHLVDGNHNSISTEALPWITIAAILRAHFA